MKMNQNEFEVKVNAKIWRFLLNTKNKINLIYGGAGAGKSYALAQFIILYLLQNHTNKYVLITRKVNPSLKLTTYRLIINLLNEYKLSYILHKSEQIIEIPNKNNFIFFRGLDDPEKIKSAEFNYIWIEEATEFSLEDFQQLKLRLRRATNTKNMMFLTFNPVPSWIEEYFFKDRKENDVNMIKLTYKDNPFLDKEYKIILEQLREQNQTMYKIYTLGEFAIPEHIIYSNYQIVDSIPNEFDEIIYGIDFGYNNPTVVLKIGIKDDVFWIIDEIYETHLTNQDLIQKLKSFVHSKNAFIFCDSAEPQRIQEIKRAGFNALPAFKDVKLGIDIVQRQKINIFRSCVNVLKEIKLYQWKQNSQGNILDEPVKFNDHAMDAMRYAISTLINTQKPKISIL